MGIESGEWRVESGEWKMGSGEWRMENGEWRVENFVASVYTEFFMIIRLFTYQRQLRKIHKVLTGTIGLKCF